MHFQNRNTLCKGIRTHLGETFMIKRERAKHDGRFSQKPTDGAS